jgi:hypothetical protein
VTAGLHPTTYGTLNVPAGVQSILMRAIMYERDIELMQSSAVTPFYDARRTDRFTTFSVKAAGDLVNTPRQFPVPGKELQTLLRELYTTRGTDSVPGMVSAIRVRNGVFNPGASPAQRTQGSLYRIGNRFVGVGQVGDIAEALRQRGREFIKKPF